MFVERDIVGNTAPAVETGVPAPSRAGGVPPLGPNAVALLDLARAGAANCVLFGHATDLFGIGTGIPAGNIGVGLFFILSGFLIQYSSLSRLRRPGPHFAPFMLDRAARIFTAYIPALLLVALANALVDLGHVGQEGVSTGPVALLGNLVLMQDYPLFQVLRRLAGDQLYIRAYNTAEPFWTIPIEFWIYAAFGLCFFGLFARERIARWLAILLGAVSLPVVLWNAAAGGGNGLSLVWLMGAAAAYVWFSGWGHAAHKRQTGAMVLALSTVCLLGRGTKIGWHFQDIGMALCEVLMLLGALSLAESARPFPATLRRACGFLASYSYSLYLVQNTILVVTRHWFGSVTACALAILAAHACAFALYRLCERHHRRVGSWLKRHLMFPGNAAGYPPGNPVDGAGPVAVRVGDPAHPA